MPDRAEDWDPADEAAVERACSGSGPDPSPRFRAELRDAFVRGRFAPGDEAGESSGSASQGEEAPRTPEHAMIEHILNKSSISEPARDDFRQELRARFVAGEFEGAAPEPASDSVFESGAPRSALRLLAWAAPLAVAAAILLIVILGADDSSWKVRSVAGDGPLVIGGTEVAVLDGPELERRIRLGQEISTGEHRVDLELGDKVRMRFEPGSRVRVEPSADDGQLALQLLAGELHGVTGPDFVRSELRIDTPRGTATITGTAFSILAVPMGACFCVDHGTVGVKEKSGLAHSVGDGDSVFLYADGSPTVKSTETELGHFRSAESRAEHGRPLRQFLTELAY